MKFTVNGKEFKEAIRICKLKGKYNEGNYSTTSALSDNIFLEVKDNILYIQNADNYTYIVYRLTGTNMQDGYEAVCGETLEKYLTDAEISANTEQGKICLLVNSTIITIPTLQRHENASVINRLKVHLSTLTRSMARRALRQSEPLQVTDKLFLTTILDLESDEFVEAMTLAEKVGNSIYKINWKPDQLVISSNRNNEEVITNINPLNSNNIPASVDISLPIGNIAKTEDYITLAYNDNNPVVFMNEKITVLRGPRSD